MEVYTMEDLAELASSVTLDMGSVYFYKDNRPPTLAMEGYTDWLKSRQKAVDGMRELLSRSRLLGSEVDFVASE